MLADDDPRLLVHLDDEQGQGLVLLILTPAGQNTPELLSIDGVVGLLEVDEGRVVPPLLALPRVNLGQDPGDMSGCRGVLLEARLVDPRLEQVRGQRRHLGHDGLLQDLGHVGPHHDGADVLELRLVLALVLGQGHQPPLVEVLGDPHGVVEEAEDLGGDLGCQPVRGISGFEEGAIEAILPRPLLKLEAFMASTTSASVNMPWVASAAA